MRVDVEYRQFAKFGQGMEKAEKDFPKFLERFVKLLGNMVLARTVKRTPRDTGLLANSWDVTKFTARGNELTIELINPVFYAFWVEEGHKTVNGNWVEGRFMAKISLDEVGELLPALHKREFEKWLRGYIGK